MLFYENPASDTKEVSSCWFLFPALSAHCNLQGLFLSPFIVAPMVKHLKDTSNAVEVPGLYSATASRQPFGAVGLAAAAVSLLI